MPWIELTIETLLFGSALAFYALALALNSKLIKRIKIGEKLIDVALKETIPFKSRRRSSWIFIVISIACFYYPLAVSLEMDRIFFMVLAGIGGIFLLIRRFYRFSDQFKLGPVYIEFISKPEADVPSLVQSPFVLGGLFIIVIGLSPFALDSAYLVPQAKNYHMTTTVQPIIKKVESPKFQAVYQERDVFYTWEGQPHNEKIFADFIAANSQRIILSGRAGSGKSWFLRNLIYSLHKKDSTKPIVRIEAKNFSLYKTLPEYINEASFPGLKWCSLPATRHVLSSAIIFIDGFDEAKSQARIKIKESIEKFAKDSPHSTIIIATRPLATEYLPVNFLQAELKDLTTRMVGDAIDRIAGRLSNTIVELKEKQKIDRQFVNLLLPQDRSATQLNWATKAQVKQLLRGFLGKYKFDKRKNGMFLFLSTFRDISIFEEMFQEAVFGNLSLAKQGQNFGRTQIYEYFIKAKIIKNYPVPEAKWYIVDDAMNKMTQACECEQVNPVTGKIAMVKSFGEDAFTAYKLEDTDLHELLLRSDVLLKEKERYKFQDDSIQAYFSSLALKAKFDADWKTTLDFIAKSQFFDKTDIIPFLFGHYDDISKLLPDYLKQLARELSDVKLITYLDNNLDLILLHLQRTEANIKHLKNNSKGSELPKKAQSVYQKKLTTYLTQLKK